MKEKKKEKTASAPTLVLFERCHSFKGLGFAHTAEMQHSTLATHAVFTKCQHISNCAQSRDKMSADKE